MISRERTPYRATRACPLRTGRARSSRSSTAPPPMCIDPREALHRRDGDDQRDAGHQPSTPRPRRRRSTTSSSWPGTTTTTASSSTASSPASSSRAATPRERDRAARATASRTSCPSRAATSSGRSPWPTPGRTPTAASSSSSAARRESRLPPQYSLFGKVVSGLDVVAAIDALGTRRARPRRR